VQPLSGVLLIKLAGFQSFYFKSKRSALPNMRLKPVSPSVPIITAPCAFGLSLDGQLFWADPRVLAYVRQAQLLMSFRQAR